MSTTLIAATPARATATATALVDTGPLAVFRAFGVMLGGPLVPLTATAAATGHTIGALRERCLPRPVAVAVLAAVAAFEVKRRAQTTA